MNEISRYAVVAASPIIFASLGWWCGHRVRNVRTKLSQDGYYGLCEALFLFTLIILMVNMIVLDKLGLVGHELAFLLLLANAILFTGTFALGRRSKTSMAVILVVFAFAWITCPDKLIIWPTDGNIGIICPWGPTLTCREYSRVENPLKFWDGGLRDVPRPPDIWRLWVLQQYVPQDPSVCDKSCLARREEDARYLAELCAMRNDIQHAAEDVSQRLLRIRPASEGQRIFDDPNDSRIVESIQIAAVRLQNKLTPKLDTVCQ